MEICWRTARFDCRKPNMHASSLHVNAFNPQALKLQKAPESSVQHRKHWEAHVAIDVLHLESWPVPMVTPDSSRALAPS